MSYSSTHSVLYCWTPVAYCSDRVMSSVKSFNPILLSHGRVLPYSILRVFTSLSQSFACLCGSVVFIWQATTFESFPVAKDRIEDRRVEKASKCSSMLLKFEVQFQWHHIVCVCVYANILAWIALGDYRTHSPNPILFHFLPIYFFLSFYLRPSSLLRVNFGLRCFYFSHFSLGQSLSVFARGAK